MIPVIIYTRFSLMVSEQKRYWKAARISVDLKEWENRILNPDRLRARCDIFFNYSLPLLSQAVNENPNFKFIHIVHATDLLPTDIKKRLDDFASSNCWFNIKYFSAYEKYELRNEVSIFLKNFDHSHANGCIVPAMRLDDDDLISPEYFKILEGYIRPHFSGMTLHTPRGFEGLYDGSGFTNFSPMDAPKTGIGLAHLAVFDVEKGMFSSKYLFPPGTHKDTDLYAPVILDGSASVIFRTKHLFNDARANEVDYLYSIDQLRKRFFGVQADLELVHKNFSSMVKK